MAKKAVSKSKKKPAPKGAAGGVLFGFTPSGWLGGAKLEKGVNLNGGDKIGHILFFGSDHAGDEIVEHLSNYCAGWQLDSIKGKKDVSHLQTAIGPVWIVRGHLSLKAQGHYGLLDDSVYGRARDLTGSCMVRVKEYELRQLRVSFFSASQEQKLGALVGLELAAYAYKSVRYGRGNQLPQLCLDRADGKLIQEAAALGCGVNIARHLVNLPGKDLNPRSYSDFIVQLFKDSSGCKVTVWKDEKLREEGLELLHSVGRGAEYPAELVRISYRPSGKGKGQQPLAFIGKGVTFDTGGLDIKQSQYMRLMKKDMGGSATLVGLAWWISEVKPNLPCDIYLALAENSVDAKSIRPGDILSARNGKTVEIHNTDAEGRLVMADAMLIAAAQSGAEKPAALIDAATLTGAMRVALGIKLAGLCSNHDGLADALLAASQRASDPCWRVPLVRDYRELLRSTVADLSNCSASPYAGAITAALFLQEFVDEEMKWAHLDMMAWAEKPAGAIGEVGGNGQMVQSLVKFLQDFDPAQLA